MFEYPPRELTTLTIVFAFAVPLSTLAFTTYWLLRRKRAAKAMDPFLWCLVAMPVVVAVHFATGSYLLAPNLSDHHVARNLNSVVNVVAAIGLFGILVRTVFRTRDFTGPFGSAVLGLIGGLVAFGLFFPALSHPPGVSRRLICKSNLKMIGLAMHNYHDQFGHFPAASGGTPPVSWRVTLLPYLDQKDLHARYDESSAWDSPGNAQLQLERVETLTCPALWNSDRDSTDPVFTAYSAPTGPNSLFAGPEPPTLRTMRDGTSNTIMVLEACGAEIVWTEPRDLDVSTTPLGVNLPGSHPGTSASVLSSLHGGVAQVLLGDGSVRVVPKETSPEVLKRLLDPDDGLLVGDF